MTVTSVYPAAIKIFPTLTDGSNVNRAVDINALGAEITEIETIMGINPTAGFTATTIQGVMAALNAGKSNVNHTHANLPAVPTTIGGPLTSSYVSVAGASIQGMLNGALAPLLIQTSGGDTTIGSITSSVSIAGSLNVAGSAILTEGLTARANSSFTSVVMNGALSFNTGVGNISLSGNEIYLWLPSTTGTVVGNNSEAILATNAYTTRFDGSNQLSVKQVIGQLYVEQVPAAAGGTGYGNAILQLNRPQALNGTHYTASIGGQAWSSSTGVYQQALLYFDANATTLGWTSGTGNINPLSTNFAFTASQFITASSSAVKVDVTDLEYGIETLLRLRPISFMHTSHTTLPGPHAPGDAKRVRTRSHGLIAEEVASILPEVIGYNGNGAPHGIDYGALVPLLIKSVQALDARVKALEFAAVNKT